MVFRRFRHIGRGRRHGHHVRVIRYGWNDGEFWKLVVPAAVALVAAIVWAALGFMRAPGGR